MASNKGQKDSKMAGDLVKKGIYHGKRQTVPTHNNYPKLTQIGSAAYRRLMGARAQG